MRTWHKSHTKPSHLRSEAEKRTEHDGHLKRKYGMGLDYYELMLKRQNGGCRICGTVAGARRLHVDHDHSCCPGQKSCGKCIRSLLCSNCNTGLGNFKDNTAMLYKAIYYLADTKHMVA